MTLWIIGYLFTIGLVEDEEDGWKLRVLLMLLWPFALGLELRDWTNKRKVTP